MIPPPWSRFWNGFAMFNFDDHWYRSLQDLLHLAADFQLFDCKLQDPSRLGCEEPPESIEASRKKHKRQRTNKVPPKNKMETTNPKVYTFYGDRSTIIRWLCTSLLFSAIGSDGCSRAVSPKYFFFALPKRLTLEIQDRQTFLHTNSYTHRCFYTQKF